MSAPAMHHLPSSPRARKARPQPHTVRCHFRVMPWDVGVANLKSDRYFAIADLAQVDFAIRAGLMRAFFREGVRWVNLAQSARFDRPLRLFQRFTVETKVVCTDEKHAYFAHHFTTAAHAHAEVFVNAKFKMAGVRSLRANCSALNPRRNRRRSSRSMARVHRPETRACAP